MGFDVFDLLLSLVVFSIYGSTCVVAILFTFFLDTYIKINEKLNLNVLSSPILTPLEIKIYRFDDWALNYNKILGPVLILLSLIDLKFFFDLISML